MVGETCCLTVCVELNVEHWMRMVGETCCLTVCVELGVEHWMGIW